jgi:polyphenol oxidase
VLLRAPGGSSPSTGFRVSAEPAFLVPDWPAPPRIRAAVSLRGGGVSVSEGRYATLNLGDHVGDRPEHVAENRRRLRAALGLPAEPAWLRQVHGTQVVELPMAAPAAEADAAWTRRAGIVCAILTADCLPVLLCDEDAHVVAAAHAGWRGLAAGVLEATVAALPVAPSRLLAWLGPAIGPAAFEVGAEVRDAFERHSPLAAAAFAPAAEGKYRADLYALARLRLRQAGVARIFGGGRCTLSEPQHFFSHRREPSGGRMASMIWLQVER